MLLTDKVSEILFKEGFEKLANNKKLVKFLSESFYEHFQNNIVNHIPIKEYLMIMVSQLQKTETGIQEYGKTQNN